MSPKTLENSTVEPKVPGVDDSQPDELEASVQQTHFAEDVVIEDVKAKKPENVEATAANPRKRLLVIGGVVGVIAFVALGVTATLLRRTVENGMNGLLQPQNGPQVTEQVQTALERDLLLLDQDIEAADPIQAKLAFPPVDFELQLEDATVLQEAAQSRSNTRR